MRLTGQRWFVNEMFATKKIKSPRGSLWVRKKKCFDSKIYLHAAASAPVQRISSFLHHFPQSISQRGLLVPEASFCLAPNFVFHHVERLLLLLLPVRRARLRVQAVILKIERHFCEVQTITFKSNNILKIVCVVSGSITRLSIDKNLKMMLI